jgi:prevent-host-death family protein
MIWVIGESMRKVGLFEAKQKLSELVERAEHGERIGITRRGKLVAVIASPRSEPDFDSITASMEQIRKRVRLPKGVTIKSLIEEGRR